MILKGISPAQLLDARVRIYESVLITASKHDILKDEAIEKANKIWNAVIELLKEDNAEKPS